MRCTLGLFLIVSLLFIFSSCESFQDGPMAVDNKTDALDKVGEPLSPTKQVRVCKSYFEGTQVNNICWTASAFNLPDFESQTFTITSVEVCLVTNNESARITGEIFGQTCNQAISACQLPTIICWQGEYPEEHPFYNGFSIQICASEVLEDIEATCSITYILH